MQALSETAVARPDLEASAGRRALAVVPDRATREAAAALARREYCARLKETREQRGVTLDSIAARTKVNEGLYVALERADLSRWPIGIYRRSFFRDYATAIGLPGEASVTEFLELFPDEVEPRASAVPPVGAGSFRMSLAGSAWVRLSRLQVLASFVDIAIVATVTALVTWWTAAAVGMVTAVVAIVYYSLATACLACSPGSWWLRTRGNRKRAQALRLAR
jgi:transcriptional regulator with XRE-family HTH domain